MNASLKIKEQEPWCPSRDEAYIGVLVDDLVTRGVTEPYRMFTSRAEFRLQLREDNADMRLTETGYRLGLVSEERWQAFAAKREAIETEKTRLRNTWISPGTLSKLQTPDQPADDRSYSLYDLLRRPEIGYAELVSLSARGQSVIDSQVAQQVEIDVKYEGYIERQRQEVVRHAQHEAMILPKDMDYRAVRGLSNEVTQKLNQHQPETIGQAARISGITPAAISLLLVHLKRGMARQAVKREEMHESGKTVA